MKTSELKKIVEDNKCRIEYIFDWVDIYENNIKVGYVSTKYKSILNIFDCCPKVIAQAILDYAYTPLEEREEEKKYRLRLNDYFRKDDFFGLYLNLLTDTVYYTFNESGDSTNGYKTDFTQKEIDDMPFDTNFFIKEEVK